MSLSSASTEERKIFGGAWTNVDIADIPQRSALLAQNVEFSPAGFMKTRFGRRSA